MALFGINPLKAKKLGVSKKLLTESYVKSHHRRSSFRKYRLLNDPVTKLIFLVVFFIRLSMIKHLQVMFMEKGAGIFHSAGKEREGVK